MDSGKSAQLKIGRMTADWNEGSVDPGDGNLTSTLDWDWNNRYDKFTNAKVSGPRDQSATGNQMDDIDVTDIVKDWLISGKANYGMILINDTSESNDAYAFCFYSEDFGSGNAPKLIIDYSENTAPTSVDDTAPIDGETVNTLTPTFTAKLNDPDGDDVTGWKMNVYTAANFGGTAMWTRPYTSTGTYNVGGGGDTVSIPYGTGGPSASVTLKPLEPGKTYYWMVTLYDEGGASVDSAWSEFTVNAPPNSPSIQVTPTPLSAIPDLTPNFSITHNDPDPSDPTAYGYTLTVQSESVDGANDWTTVWSTGDIDISGSPVSSIQITSATLAWGGSYRVYARTQDSNGAWGPYSSPIEFQLQHTSPPVGLSPSGNVITGSTPVLSGLRGSQADTISKFTLRVYTDDLTTAVLSETEYTTGTDGNVFSKVYSGVSLIAGDAYRWSAKVYSAIGGYSDWSSWQRFVVQNDVSVPEISSPVGDGGYGLTPTITLGRASDFDALEYEIYPESATIANLRYTSLFIRTDRPDCG